MMLFRVSEVMSMSVLTCEQISYNSDNHMHDNFLRVGRGHISTVRHRFAISKIRSVMKSFWAMSTLLDVIRLMRISLISFCSSVFYFYEVEVGVASVDTDTVKSIDDDGVGVGSAVGSTVGGSGRVVVLGRSGTSEVGTQAQALLTAATTSSPAQPVLA